MGRLSTRSNPTGLKEIPKGRITIFVSVIDGQRHFSLQKLDLDGLSIPHDSSLICIARAGKTSHRFEMGSVDVFRRENIALEDLDLSESLRFRVLVHSGDDPRLVASAENLRPLDESQSESLLPMEPAELGQLLWKLDFVEDGPVLKFNSTVFPSAVGVENYLPFAALVLPEAVRQILKRIAEQPDVLDDENDPLSVWGSWLDSYGLERPKSFTEKDEQDWCNFAVDAFCNHHSFATRLASALASGGAVND